MSSDPYAATVDTVDALDRLSAALRATGLELDLGSATGAVAVRNELADQITDYIVPRLRRLDAPLLAVLGGSTGSGKSTITNTLIGVEVSPAGVLRPTTRAPVLICHPDDEAWFAGGDVLPDLARVTGGPAGSGAAGASGTVLRITTTDDIEPGLALIDAPDIDSVEEANRDLATQLLSAADLWLFATTAVRYADAVPWDFLRQAQARGTALACIINRIPPGAAGEIVPHFESMLTKAGLEGVTVFPIDQTDLVDGKLPPAAVEPIKQLLTRLATNAEERARVVRQTLDGALGSIPGRARQVLAAAQEQNAAVDELALAVQRIYDTTIDAVGRDISSGAMLRGEVLERWQELIGTAELMRAVQSRISWIRDRIGSMVTGRTGATAEVQGEITSTLEQLLIDHGDKAASTTVSTWKNLPGGRRVLGDDRSLEWASPEFRNQVRSEIQGWQEDILDLVRDRGASKRTTARVLALGVNSVGIALMVLLFAQTGGITGGEVAIGAGTAGLSQTLLTALFGEQAVRELATEARRLLMSRVQALFDADADRFTARLDAAVTPDNAAEELDAAINSYAKVAGVRA